MKTTALSDSSSTPTTCTSLTTTTTTTCNSTSSSSVNVAAAAATNAAQAQLLLANQHTNKLDHSSSSFNSSCKSDINDKNNNKLNVSKNTKENYRMRQYQRNHNDFVRKRNDHDEKFIAEINTDDDYDSSDDSCLLKTILENNQKFCDDINNDASSNEYRGNNELTDFEKEVLRKYIGEIDLEMELMPPSLEKVLLSDDNNNDIPTCVADLDGELIVDVVAGTEETYNHYPTNECSSSMLAAPVAEPRTDGASSSSVRRDSRTDRGNPRQRTRVQRRNNLSVWVGVTTCVWGILLYFVRTYM
jgi:hypothetical protein